MKLFNIGNRKKLIKVTPVVVTIKSHFYVVTRSRSNTEQENRSRASTGEFSRKLSNEEKSEERSLSPTYFEEERKRDGTMVVTKNP